MIWQAALLTSHLAAVSAAGQVMNAYIAPVLVTLSGLAGLTSVFFLVNGGVLYMTSSGKPENLDHAKRVIKNALLGLVIVLAAGAIAALLSHAYTQPTASVSTQLPPLSAIKTNSTGLSIVDVIIKAITGVLSNVITAIATPFLHALTYFTSGTPLMGDNSTVFNLWLAILGITDALFVLVIAFLGFHLMSAATFGLDEVDFRQLLPRIAGVFLLINVSLFIIDGIISLSNAMIKAIGAGFPYSNVWTVLTKVAGQSGALSLAALLIMVVFVVLVAILLVYYVGRLLTLYLGAALAPIVFVLLLIPAFKDFAMSAIKTYIATIFVLFVHVVILVLAASIFAGLIQASPTQTPDPIMSIVVGLAAVIALLKTQGVLMQLSYASIGPRTARKLGGQFINGVAYIGSTSKTVIKSPSNRIQAGAAAISSKSGKNMNSNQSTIPTSNKPTQSNQKANKQLPTGTTKPAPRASSDTSSKTSTKSSANDNKSNSSKSKGDKS